MVAIAIGSIAVAGFEDEKDADGDQGKSDHGTHPMKSLVLGKAVNEQTNGQPDSSTQSSIEAGLGRDLHARVLGQRLVLADLKEVKGETDGSTKAERDVRESGDTFIPTTLLLESNGDHGQEEESQEPGKSNPQTKSEHHGFSEKHLHGLDGRVVQHVLDTRGFEIVVGDEALIPSGLANFLRTLGEADAATSLGQANKDDDTQGNVGQALDALEPAPAQSLVNETGVNGGTDSAQDSNEREAGHGNGTVLGGVHITEGSADKNSTDTTKQTEKGTADKNSSDIFTQGKTDEHETKTDIGTDIDDSTTSQFTEWSEEEGCQSTSEVEGKKTNLANFG